MNVSFSVEIALSDDHQAIDGLYEAYLAEKERGAEKALHAFRTYKAALLRHIKCEEDLIFPVLNALPSEPASEEVPTLRLEHQTMVPLLMEVEKHLKEGTDPSLVERRLFEELHEHNAREELKVYEALDRLLSDAEKQEVAQALQSRHLFANL